MCVIALKLWAKVASYKNMLVLNSLAEIVSCFPDDLVACECRDLDLRPGHLRFATYGGACVIDITKLSSIRANTFVSWCHSDANGFVFIVSTSWEAMMTRMPSSLQCAWNFHFTLLLWLSFVDSTNTSIFAVAVNYCQSRLLTTAAQIHLSVRIARAHTQCQRYTSPYDTTRSLDIHYYMLQLVFLKRCRWRRRRQCFKWISRSSLLPVTSVDIVVYRFQIVCLWENSSAAWRCRMKFGCSRAICCVLIVTHSSQCRQPTAFIHFHKIDTRDYTLMKMGKQRNCDANNMFNVVQVDVRWWTKLNGA